MVLLRELNEVREIERLLHLVVVSHGQPLLLFFLCYKTILFGFQLYEIRGLA